MGLKVFKFSFKMGWKLQEDEIEVMHLNEFLWLFW